MITTFITVLAWIIVIFYGALISLGILIAMFNPGKTKITLNLFGSLLLLASIAWIITTFIG